MECGFVMNHVSTFLNIPDALSLRDRPLHDPLNNGPMAREVSHVSAYTVYILVFPIHIPIKCSQPRQPGVIKASTLDIGAAA